MTDITRRRFAGLAGATVALRCDELKYLRLDDGTDRLHDLTADPREQANLTG